jgi:hypothetical protein
MGGGHRGAACTAGGGHSSRVRVARARCRLHGTAEHASCAWLHCYSIWRCTWHGMGSSLWLHVANGWPASAPAADEHGMVHAQCR